MHSIEPYFNWRNLYVAEEDERSPFFGRQYSEVYFTDTIYDYYIHPQWDNFGSSTLFMKLLYADYEDSYAIIELLGEWNDTLYNDIMVLKREIIDVLVQEGIQKFILIGDNVLNFHPSDDSYYEEWFDDLEDGWIALVNFRQHVLSELSATGIDQYVSFGGPLDDLSWGSYRPLQFFQRVSQLIDKRFNPNYLLEEGIDTDD